MMRGIVGWSLRARLVVVGIAAALLVLGATQLRNMPADTLPELSPTYVEVQTEALGLSAEEVEQLITVPLEADLLGSVRGVSTLRSESVPGLSSITLVFEKGTDLLTARQYTQEKLSEAVGALPNVSKSHEMIQPRSSSGRVLMIGLDSSKLSPIEQGVLARWTIRPRLMGVPGVSNVEIWGQRERQLQVLVDPKRLKERNVSLLQVIKTAGNAQLVSPLSFLEGSTPGTGGFFDTPNQRLGVRHVFPLASPDDLARVKVEETGGNLHLGDVAKVVEGHQPLIGDASVNDHSGLMLVVEKLPGANTKEVTEGIEEALDDLRPGLSGLEVDSNVFRPADFLDDAISHVSLALLAGFLLAALVLALFLYEWRPVLAAAISVLLSLVAAALVLDLFGATMNSLVFAGLVLAVVVIVHDAVLDLGVWGPRAGDDPAGPGATLDGLMGARRSLVSATLMVGLSVTPVLLMEGVAGDVFRPVALGYALTVVASLLVAVSVTPAMGSLLAPRASAVGRGSPAVRWLRPRYESALARLTRGPGTVFVAIGVLAVVGVAALPSLEQPALPGLLPNFKERELLVRFDAEAGTSQPEMTRIANRATAELRHLGGVTNVGAHVGRAVSGDVVGGVNKGEIWLTVGEDADYDEAVAGVRDVIAGYPGLDHEIVSYSSDRARTIGRMEDGADDERSFRDDDVSKALSSDLTIRVYGQRSDVLLEKAGEVKRMAAGVDGVETATAEPQTFEPTVEIEPNLTAAEKVGIKPGEVRRAAAGLLSGIIVGNLFEAQKVFDVVVWGAPEVRRSVGDIRDLLIDVPGGGHVRLADVADVRIRPTPTEIRRESVARYVDVGIDVDGRDRSAVEDDLKREVRSMSWPLEYHAETINEAGEHSSAFKRVLALAIAAAIAVFLLLQASLGSWRLAALLFATLPLALVGGLVALFIDGGVISIGVVFGLLGLLAIAARNGLALVGRLGDPSPQAAEPEVTDAVARIAAEQLLPVLASALATIAFLAPIVVAGSVAGLEILHPMAVVVFGGLITSTLVALLIVPALYLRLGRNS
jgi:Cu/Ag efflux pump CusA